MKKTLLVLGLLAMVTTGFADDKSDYEAAVNLARQGKISEAVVKLDQVSKGKDKVYTVKSRFQLGVYYSQQNDAASVKKYLEPIWNEESLTADERKVVLELLYAVALQERNFPKLEMYIKELDKISNGEDADYASSYILVYLLQNRNNEAMTRYNMIQNSPKSADFKSIVNYNVASFYLNENKLPEAKKYFTESYKMDTSFGYESGFNLYKIAVFENNLKEAERLLVELDSKLKGSNDLVTNELGMYYYNVRNYNKAESYFKKLEAKYPNSVEAKTVLLAIYERLGNNANVKKYYDSIKQMAPQVTNEVLGNAYANIGDEVLSEKYLKKAIQEDKNNNVRLQLIRLYALTGKIDEAKLEAKEAVKLKVNGAKELLKELEEIRK